MKPPPFRARPTDFLRRCQPSAPSATCGGPPSLYSPADDLAALLASFDAEARSIVERTTNQGWFQLFRSRALQTYLKAHPDLVTSLKASSVPPAEYSSHIPPSDLRAIDNGAQSKADTRCPAASTSPS